MDKGIPMRKRIAMGQTDQDGGSDCASLESLCRGNHPDAGKGVHNKHLADHERGASPPLTHSQGFMKAQANPHHGPHHHRGRGR